MSILAIANSSLHPVFCCGNVVTGVEMLWVTDGSKLGRFEIYGGKYMEDNVGHVMNALEIDYRHKKAYFISSDSIYE
jgi:hypothetical protein